VRPTASKGKEVWLLVGWREVGGGRSSGGSELGMAVNGGGSRTSLERGGWRACVPERANGIRDHMEHETCTVEKLALLNYF